MPFNAYVRLVAAAPLLALGLAPTTAAAAPQQVFDSWNGQTSTSSRAAGSSPGSLITVSGGTQTINYIAVRVDLNAAGNLKFVVFSHPAHALLYVSPPKNFADDGMTWKMSNNFTLMLPPGQYDIGAIADVGGLWQFDSAAAAMGNFSSTVSNPNFSNYATPSSAGHGGADGAVRLFIESAVCGDGKVDPGEACDDGNAVNTDACLSNCQMAACGDSQVWAGNEECDDGNAVNTDACLDTCFAASCGDGFVWAGNEACDDGNADNTDTCLTTCVAASCGDGFVGPGEGCDDGNMVDDDTCSNACVSASCGDGVVQMGEGCDDGNMIDDDACTNTCAAPTCGDGILQAGEECDDGNLIDDDECTGACLFPVCGDGILHPTEVCDDGNTDPGDGCEPDCTPTPACGNGEVEAGEACDDGNTDPGDGCEPDCTLPGDSATTGGGETTGTTGGDSGGSDTDTTGTGTTGGTGLPGTGTGLSTGATTFTTGGGADEDGCSCRAPANASTPALWGLLALLGLARRRRTG